MVGAEWEEGNKDHAKDWQTQYLRRESLRGNDRTKDEFFAYPFIKNKQIPGFLLSQTGAIVLYLANKFKIIPSNELHYYRSIQIMMQIIDIIEDAHWASHPVKRNGPYAEQKDEAEIKLNEFCLYNKNTKEMGRLGKQIIVIEAELLRYGNGKGYFYDESSPTYIDCYVFIFMRAFVYSRPNDYKKFDFIPCLKAFYDRFQKETFWVNFSKSNKFPKIDNGPSFQT